MKLFSIFKKSTEAAPRFNDNMNYMIFEGEGIYSKTGRKRKEPERERIGREEKNHNGL